MKDSHLTALAIKIAADVHLNQIDRGGNAYILHPLRLMMRLRTNDQELMQIAVLHDVIEDSAGTVTLKTIKEYGFSSRVWNALVALTHHQEDSYEQYIENIALNADATRVKLEDLRDNSDITRLKGVREKDLERMAKYHRAYLRLSEVMRLNNW